MADLRFVEGGPEHADDIRDLLRLCYPANPKADPGVIEWQYWSNPFGPTHTMIALDGERVVGHHTSFSLPVALGTESVTAGTRVDAATHPEYRRRGIYAALTAPLSEAGRADGTAFLFTNPNDQSERLSRAIGFTEIAEPRLFVLPVKSDWIGGVTRAPGIVGRVATAWMRQELPTGGAGRARSVPEGVDELASEVWDDDLVGIRPGFEWWQWRFAEHPGQPYLFYETGEGGTLEGALVVRHVTRRGQPSLQILDAVARSRDAARALVGSALADAPEMGAVIAMGAGGGPFIRFLRQVGMRRVPRRVRGRRSVLGIVPLAVEPDRVDPLTWAVSGGLFDYA